MLFSSITFCFISADHAGSLLYRTISMEESPATCRQSDLLCLGRTGLYHSDDTQYLLNYFVEWILRIRVRMRRKQNGHWSLQ